ncbi:MAG: ribulose-phosphate 3-epimerase [Oscillospiraceae bacterium]
MDSKIIISPSVASANQLKLRDEVEFAQHKGARDIHIDIEDGNFIPNITFGTKTVKGLRSCTDLPFSFHLMVTEQFEWLNFAALMKPSIVFGHYEALCYPRAFVGAARKLGVRCGLAFNPKTPIEQAKYLIDDLDGILLLAVEPDGMGENFIESVLEKADIIRGLSPKIEIWVDGNVTQDRLSMLEEHGVTNAVMGRGFFFDDR